jgi:hypothetical protein
MILPNDDDNIVRGLLAAAHHAVKGQSFQQPFFKHEGGVHPVITYVTEDAAGKRSGKIMMLSMLLTTTTIMLLCVVDSKKLHFCLYLLIMKLLCSAPIPAHAYNI